MDYTKLKKQIIDLNTLNHYFLDKYVGIENDIEFIRKFDITLGQQLKRLKDYEEYQILKPYLLPKTFLSLMDIKLLNKIKSDIVALERFAFKEDEIDEKSHFKDVERCLKQERFKDNYFYHDVFVHCKSERIEYYDSIKLVLLKKTKNLNEEIGVISLKFAEKYISEDKDVNIVLEETNSVKELGVNPNEIAYHLLWFSKSENDFEKIKLTIKNFDLNKVFMVSDNVIDKENNKIFLECIKQEKEELLNLVLNDNKCSNFLLNNVLSDLNFKKLKNKENEIIKNCFLKMFNRLKN